MRSSGQKTKGFYARFDDDRFAVSLQSLYDRGLVRALKVSRTETLAGDSDRLGIGIFRILLASSRQSNRLRNVQRLPAQDHPRSPDSDRLYRIRGDRAG